jgi:hypothetical protein
MTMEKSIGHIELLSRPAAMVRTVLMVAGLTTGEKVPQNRFQLAV